MFEFKDDFLLGQLSMCFIRWAKKFGELNFS